MVYADEEGLTIIHNEKWLPKICCNRCGKYMEDKRKLLDSISKFCCSIDPATNNGKAMQVMSILTKRLAETVCAYYKVKVVWNEELPKIILENPRYSFAAISTYIQGVQKQSKKAA